MADANIQRWRQRGTIFVYRFRNTSRREWNLTADDEARGALLELFDLMEHSRWPSKVALRVSKPVVAGHGEVGAKAGGQEFQAAQQLVLRYQPDGVPVEHWEITGAAESLELAVGLARLAELRRAVADIRQGGGDYAMGADAARLWVWWWLGQPAVGLNGP